MRAQRSDAIDGLRALAALSVLAFHVWLYRDDRPRLASDRTLLDRVLFEANVGLLLFFVLSGFLLFRGYARAAARGGDPGAGPSVRAYARRRAARILPAYYACGLGCLLLYATVGPTTVQPRIVELPLFAVLGQNYAPGTLMQLNPVTWTLVVEAAFYVVLPLVGLAVLALRHRGQVVLLVALVGVTIGWYLADWTWHWGEIPRKTLPAWIGHFALGMLVALWLERRAARGRGAFSAPVTGGLLALGIAAVVGQGIWHELTPYPTLARALLATLTSAAGFALVVAAVAGGGAGVTRGLRARPLRAVGVVSYGLYLWHLPLLLVLRDNGLLPGALAPRTAVVLGVSLAAAAASWRWIERPAIAWGAGRPAGHVGTFTRSQQVSVPTG